MERSEFNTKTTKIIGKAICKYPNNFKSQSISLLLCRFEIGAELFTSIIIDVESVSILLMIKHAQKAIPPNIIEHKRKKCKNEKGFF